MHGSDVVLRQGSLAEPSGTEGAGVVTAAGRGPAEAANVASAAAGSEQEALCDADGLSAASTAGSDVRWDKVISLKAAIDAGSYNVPSAEVAEKLLSHLLR